MKLGILVNTALRSIMKNRFRSFLTMLGIIIGVASVIVMVSVGLGAQKKIEQHLASMGTNLLTVFPGSGRFDGMRQSINSLTLEDARQMALQCPALTAVSPVVRSTMQIVAGNKNWNTSVVGVSPDYFIIRSWKLTYGVTFSEKGVKGNAKVALLGTTVAMQLFGDVNPMGKRIRIGNIPFTVLGLLVEKGTSAGPGGDQDDAIYAPVTTVLHCLTGGTHVQTIMASARSQRDMANAQTRIAELLRKRHQLRNNNGNDFTIMNQTEIINMAAETSNVLTWLLGSIAAVSLLVGGIGIMNIMLVSVTERTKEIGIRLSVGARTRDIRRQFLVEAVVLCMIGGFFGILVGSALSSLLTVIAGITTSISLFTVVAAVIFSGGIGILFGYFPAGKASDMNPIDALRYE